MSPLRYLPSDRAVDATSSTPTASTVPTPTSSSSDPSASALAPHIPNWIPVAVLVLFGFGVLGMMYWAYKSSAGKLPSSKNIFKERSAAQSAHPKLGAREQRRKSQLKATISRPPPAHTAAPGPGSEAVVSRFADTTSLTTERRATPMLAMNRTLPPSVRPPGAR
ncbi:hypothetical protein DFH09DRAFT_1095533 [Mycena vulgaris]|nr:hypothetical protein DFH09DRAFT_1095533 [Mycena vulgaris]